MAQKELIEIYKNIGETPLECIGRFKAENPQYKGAKMTYLGRLDPMAEGLLLVLSGDTRGKAEFLAFDKTYEFEVLWGFETDTYDVLGLVTAACPLPQKLDVKMGKLLDNIKNKKTQSYPPYSSRTAGGVALWQLSRDNLIKEIDVPERAIKIFSLEHIHTRLVRAEEVLEEIEGKIALVQGDFRQKEIARCWKKAMSGMEDEMFMVSKFTADVSSGTYIRGLAHEMGKASGSCALAYSIKRTRVGEYKI